MFKYSSIFFLLTIALYIPVNAQDSITKPKLIAEKYLEDQFYAVIAYNALLNKPNNVIQRNLSYSLQFGFIKDIPINLKRNFGFGLGLGYGTNSYYSNIIAENTSQNITYRLSIETDNLRRSKFETHAIEFPFEIRWRTSNAVEYKFWRIYTGIKAAYLFSRRSKFVSENANNNLSFRNDDISQWQYGLTLNFGYNTWNVHLNYSLKPLLENNPLIDGEIIEIKPLTVGLVFYIL